MINYVIGDALDPVGGGTKIIPHVCNDVGLWGAGFVKAISAKWSRPQEDYYDWYDTKGFYNTVKPFKLGEYQFVQVEDNPSIYIVNMIAQAGVRSATNPVPIKYYALSNCLANVGRVARDINASIHLPRIGCGLAGGEWDKVEGIIHAVLPDLSVTVYDLE